MKKGYLKGQDTNNMAPKMGEIKKKADMLKAALKMAKRLRQAPYMTDVSKKDPKCPGTKGTRK